MNEARKDRFWKSVACRGPDECWLWRGCVDKDGYGKTTVEYVDRRAHRVALELSGVSVTGLMVLHSCDTPACCNPAHLRAGTVAENADDMKRRGRAASGERNAMVKNPERSHFSKVRFRKVGEEQAGAKLTDEAVREIRRKYVPRVYGLPRLAAEYGVGTSTIHRVIKGTHWAHVG